MATYERRDIAASVRLLNKKQLLNAQVALAGVKGVLVCSNPYCQRMIEPSTAELVDYLRIGWPKCHGRTMELVRPEVTEMAEPIFTGDEISILRTLVQDHLNTVSDLACHYVGKDVVGYLGVIEDLEAKLKRIELSEGGGDPKETPITAGAEVTAGALAAAAASPSVDANFDAAKFAEVLKEELYRRWQVHDNSATPDETLFAITNAVAEAQRQARKG